MAKKTALDKGDKSDKRGSSADKHGGDKTPSEPPKNAEENEVLGKINSYFIRLHLLLKLQLVAR